jgi:hypothetical protein
MEKNCRTYSLVVGINDHLLCKDGWHERSSDERSGTLYRPSMKEASFTLNLPGGNLEIHALISAGTSLCGGCFRGKLISGDENHGDFSLNTENWVIRKFLFHKAKKGLNLFKWVIDTPYIPDDVLHNGDFREMGLYMAAVRVEILKDQ